MAMMNEQHDHSIELEYKLFMQNKDQYCNYDIDMGFGEVMKPLPKYQNKHFDNFDMSMSENTSMKSEGISELPEVKNVPFTPKEEVVPLVPPNRKQLGVKLEKTQDKIQVEQPDQERKQLPLNDTLNHLITSMTLDQDMF